MFTTKSRLFSNDTSELRGNFLFLCLRDVVLGGGSRRSY